MLVRSLLALVLLTPSPALTAYRAGAHSYEESNETGNKKYEESNETDNKKYEESNETGNTKYEESNETGNTKYEEAPSLRGEYPNKDVVVETECGKIRGRVNQTRFGEVEEFLQIPYAVPPIGSLRWTHSQLLTPGTHERCDGDTDHSPPQGGIEGEIQCVQYWKSWVGEVEGVEDCLYLSVRSPKQQQNDEDEDDEDEDDEDDDDEDDDDEDEYDQNGPKDGGKKLPVLVWIHGNGLLAGWRDQPGYAPTAELTADLNVVTVNINYRLDVFGFLSVPEIWQDGENYGNFGIGDAITALKWVQRNIGRFGGDANSVTIIGESSGANIVLGLLAAPKADGLFNRAIALSSSPKWVSTHEDAYRRRKDYISKVGCDQGDLETRRNCLKNLDVKTLIENRDLDRGYGFYDFPYSYKGELGESMDYNVIEPTIVPFAPDEIYKNWTPKTKVKVILSNTAQENGYCAFSYHICSSSVNSWEEAEDLLDERLKTFKKETGKSVKRGFRERLAKKYRFDENSEAWWAQIGWDTLTTDVRATCPTNQLNEALNKVENYQVYRMYIEHYADETTDRGFKFESIHGWDTEALFGYGLYKLNTTNNRHQRKFQQNLRDLVAYVCYDEEIAGWSTDNTLIFKNNQDFPQPVQIKNTMPRESACKVWQKYGFSGYGWQN